MIAKNYNSQPRWTKNVKAIDLTPMHSRAITAKQLRNDLFEAVTAATGGEEIRCHTIKESKYGEIISTSSVIGIQVITDDKGEKHLIIQTN